MKVVTTSSKIIKQWYLKLSLDQFEKNDVWKLLSPIRNKNIIGEKWAYRNKLNEQGKVVKNNARLVAKGYS